MSDVGGALLWREEVKPGADLHACFVEAAFGSLAQPSLKLAEDFLDWAEVGAIGRQEPQLGTNESGGLPHRLALVRTEIVHQHDVARPERRQQELPHIDEEAWAIDRGVEHARGIDAVMTRRSDEGHGLPVSVRHLGAQPLTVRRTAMEPGHVVLAPLTAFGAQPPMKIRRLDPASAAIAAIVHADERRGRSCSLGSKLFKG